MLSFKETGTLLWRKKLYAVVALGFLGAAASYALATRSTAKVNVLTATGDAWILVKLETTKTWSAADAYCTLAYDTHLAVIEDLAANQAMNDALTHYSVPAWIGFADLQNKDDFEWVDASPKAYTNWDEGEPTDLCVHMLASGKWKDVDCSESLTSFFCEAPAAMTATAVVRLDNFEVHSLDAAIGSGEAQAYCQSQDADLYSVIDEADNERIATALRAAKVEFAFIGLETAPQSYAWADGRPLDFNMWATDEPKQNVFSQIRASDGQWMTVCSEATLLGVVCEQMNYAPTITPPTTTTTPPPPIANHFVAAVQISSQYKCLGPDSLYDSDKVATAVRCVGGGQCFSASNECYPIGVTYVEAKSICEVDGRRLPTMIETATICRDVGCSFDYYNVWSSDECPSSEEVPAGALRGHYAYEDTGGRICLGDDFLESDGIDTAIRCCAIDDGRVLFTDTCYSGNPCYGTRVTFDEAQQKCADVDKELCNHFVVENQCQDTGCGYDYLYVRSSIACFGAEEFVAL